MPLKMLNRNDQIRMCFEAYMNFKGICNQDITAGMKCAGVSVFVWGNRWEHPFMMNCVRTLVSAPECRGFSSNKLCIVLMYWHKSSNTNKVLGKNHYIPCYLFTGLNFKYLNPGVIRCL